MKMKYVVLLGVGLAVIGVRVARRSGRPARAAAAGSNSSEALIDAVRAALADCDADAFAALVYTTDAPESQDLSAHRGMLKEDCGKTVASIKIEPLAADDPTSYEMRGVRYRPTLPPAGKLVIRFSDETDSAVRGETTSFLVGQRDGHWWVLTSEPDK